MDLQKYEHSSLADVNAVIEKGAHTGSEAEGAAYFRRAEINRRMLDRKAAAHDYGVSLCLLDPFATKHQKMLLRYRMWESSLSFRQIIMLPKLAWQAARAEPFDTVVLTVIALMAFGLLAFIVYSAVTGN